MCHPWIWLNEPQHGTAVSAVTSIISALATALAATFAFFAYTSAKKQASEAHKQTGIAQDVADFNREQLKQERAARVDEIRKAYFLDVAREDATRPVFRLDPGIQIQDIMRSELRNAGASAASSITVWQPGVERPIAVVPSLAPNASYQIGIVPATLANPGYDIHYTTSFGSQWKVRLRQPEGSYQQEEEIVDVFRPYTPHDVVTG